MWKILSRINKNLVTAIPLALTAGFVWGIFVDASGLKNLLVPLTFLMVYPMMVTLKFKKVLEGGDTKAQFLTQTINFAVIPFVALGLGKIFFADAPYMALGLLMAALVPTSGMTISWTGFAKGNMAAAVKMTVVGLVLGSLATPFYLEALAGETVQVDFIKVVRQIALIVFLPMIAGIITQTHLIKRYGQKKFMEEIGPKFPGISTIGVLGIVFIAMALKAPAIAAAPGMIPVIFLPLLLLYGFNFTLSTLAGRTLLPRGDGIALVYGTVMRNLSIALAVAINSFGSAGSEAALVISLAYIIQVQSAAWYVKFTDRIFGTVS